MIWDNINKCGKQISSVVAVGDIIEVEYLGEPRIFKVEKFEVLLNHDEIRPIDFVIHVRFSYNDGISWTECTSDHFKYIRHIK